MSSNDWLNQCIATVDGYHRYIMASVDQLSDEQLFQRPAPGFNSVANLLRHLGGNLKSRWTHFLTEDGEKPDRDRDSEFADWDGDRESLLAFFDDGWNCLRSTLSQLSNEDLAATVSIRGEPHSVPQATVRSLTHISYHVGQIVMIARMVHGDNESWNWFTIAPGNSQQFNQSTWGTAKSRGIAGEK